MTRNIVAIRSLFLTVVMTVILCMATAAGAEVPQPKKWVWHNIEMIITDTKDTPTESQVSLETYLQHSKSGKIVTTTEAQKEFGNLLLRPKPFRLPLVSANGVYQQYFTIANGKRGEPKTMFSHWDIFHKDNEWVAVKQDIDQYTTDQLKMKGIQRQEFPSYMKVLKLSGSDNDTLITPLGNGNTHVAVHILNKEGKVTRLQIIGNLSEQELLSVATGYTVSGQQQNR